MPNTLKAIRMTTALPVSTKRATVSALIRLQISSCTDSETGIVRVQDLLHLAKVNALHKTLSRLCKDGTLLRVSRGVYRVCVNEDVSDAPDRALENCWSGIANAERH